ncbi:hypothetical protein Lal_00024381 [Lupinus albus]|nr:hypothetical protein Lal_00024381 [Lupinus albus]
MTRDNLYCLSHDQVALFKSFRGTASMCKQTINHAVPRIKQHNSLVTERKGEKGGRNCVCINYERRKRRASISVLALGASNNEEGRPLSSDLIYGLEEVTRGSCSVASCFFWILLGLHVGDLVKLEFIIHTGPLA